MIRRILLTLLLAAVAVVLFIYYRPSKMADGYQAVFLVNNQVYFGRLSDRHSQFPVLRDVYYLKVNEQLQPATGKKTDTPAPDVSLIKLGSELHGPTDEMELNRDQILLVETLRDDSSVVRAIKEYKQQGSATSTPAQ